MIKLRNNKQLSVFKNQEVELCYHDIVSYLANHDAPLDYLIAGELAQLQTFGIPSISKLLRRTKQYEDHGTKRLDDTRAILVETMKDTVHSDRGAHMVTHLNWIHSHYTISNDDYLYTLALFMIEPDRWMRTFGYRALEDHEREAAYLEFRDLGLAMNIKDIPSSFSAFKAWYDKYRSENLTYHPDNQVVAEGLINGMKPMVPFFLRPIIKDVMATLINDTDLLNALGFEEPNKIISMSVKALMVVRANVLKVFNPWQKKAFETGHIAKFYPTYPEGYEQQVLGPNKLVKHSEAGAGCPFHAVR